MEKYKFSKHALKMLAEREIDSKWVSRTIEKPDKIEDRDTEEVHYLKKITESSNRILRVVINPQKKVIITAFFDRRLRE